MMTSSRKQLAPAAATSKTSPAMRTLFLKEQLFCDQLEVTDELLQSLREVGILVKLSQSTDNEQHSLDQCTNQKKSGGSKTKVRMLLDDLKNNWTGDDIIRKFCIVLNEFNPWLSDELRQELSGELGEQQTSEALDLENGRIVFKEFGCEKRLSELEKKRLHKLLNRKTQCSRDIWQKQLDRLSGRIEESATTNGAIESEATTLADDIHAFLEQNAAQQFQSRAIMQTARTTSELFTDLPALQKLENYTNGLIQLAGQTRMEAENIEDEKERVATRIHLKNKTGPIDEELRRYMDEKRRAISDYREAVHQQLQLVMRLTKETETAETEKKKAAANRQAIIDEMNEKIKVKETENDAMSRYIDQLRRELTMNENDLKKFTNRSEELERGKRVQQIFGAAPTSIRSTIVNDLDIMEQRKNRPSSLSTSASISFSSSSNSKQQQQPTVGKVSFSVDDQLPKLNGGPSSSFYSSYSSSSLPSFSSPQKKTQLETQTAVRR